MRVSLLGGAMDGAVLYVVVGQPGADGLVTLPERLVVHHDGAQCGRLEYRVAAMGEADGCTMVQLSSTGKPVYRFVGEL